jgi:uncharacterized protein YbbK (DUF523 family)
VFRPLFNSVKKRGNMEKILISGCLMGQKVRYNGFDVPCDSEHIDQWREEQRIVTVCPEISAGLPAPRPSSEIKGGSGKDVLSGQAKVITHNGIDRTALFLKGAQFTLMLAKKHNIKVAILKSKSPSCGNNTIYDGTYSGNVVSGSGVTATLLMQNGIKVFNEFEIDQAAQYLVELEGKKSLSM